MNAGFREQRAARSHDCLAALEGFLVKRRRFEVAEEPTGRIKAKSVGTKRGIQTAFGLHENGSFFH